MMPSTAVLDLIKKLSFIVKLINFEHLVKILRDLIGFAVRVQIFRENLLTLLYIDNYIGNYIIYRQI